MNGLLQVSTLRFDRYKRSFNDPKGSTFVTQLIESILPETCSEEVLEAFFKVCGELYFETHKQEFLDSLTK